MRHVVGQADAEEAVVAAAKFEELVAGEWRAAAHEVVSEYQKRTEAASEMGLPGGQAAEVVAQFDQFFQYW